jgi:hypothetical protein
VLLIRRLFRAKIFKGDQVPPFYEKGGASRHPSGAAYLPAVYRLLVAAGFLFYPCNRELL